MRADSSRPPPTDYLPFRKEVLTPAQLRDFSRLRPWVPVRDTLFVWLQIALVIAFTAWANHWLAYCFAFVAIGNRFYTLYIIAHDGLHRRLFSDQRLNDLWNDVTILGSIGAITRLNRNNHMEHHRCMGASGDPDVYKYERPVPRGAVALAAQLLCVPYVLRAVANVFQSRPAPADVQAGRGYRLRDLLILAGWQIFLIGVFTSLYGWWGYFVLWWGSLYVFTFCADVTRVWLEHGAPGQDEATAADRLITYEPSWFERALLAPAGMHFHVAHHLWPAIPYYRLREATEALRSSPLAERLVWRRSYLRQLLPHQPLAGSVPDQA